MLRRAEAPSCSLSELWTQRAFDRVPLCVRYTRPLCHPLPNTYAQSSLRDHSSSAPNLRGTTLQFLVPVCSITAAPCKLRPPITHHISGRLIKFYKGNEHLLGGVRFCLGGSRVIWLRSMQECCTFCWLENVPLNKCSILPALFSLIESMGPRRVSGQKICVFSPSVYPV